MTSVGRPRISWLLAVPLIVTGSLVAHELAYWLVGRKAPGGSHVLSEPGHGYLDHAPVALAVLGAMLVAALAGRIVSALRGRPAARGAAWPFFLLPPLAFILQEHLERLFGDGNALLTAVEPTFIAGLALQLPFALAAYALSRALSTVADSVGRAIAEKRSTPPSRGVAAGFPLDEASLPRVPALALGYAQRGPPLPS